MMSKKIICLLAAAIFMFNSNYTYTSASEKTVDPSTICYGSTITNAHVMPAGEPIYESFTPYALRADVTVNVSSPCDQLFRNTYPSSYAYEANRAIENADDHLSKFGINYVSVAQPIWTSPSSSDSTTILDDAISDHGIQYNGNLTADIMIAFSGITAYAGSLRVVGQVDAIGSNYSTIFHTDYDGNSYNVQHETGHLYMLRHHNDPNAGLSFPSNPTCVMNSGLDMVNFDQLCSVHDSQWSTNSGLH